MKRKLTKFERIEKYLDGSKMDVQLHTDERGKLSRAYIQIGGPLSHIPSLKNSKMPGSTFTNPSTIAKLQALDILWLRNGPRDNHESLSFGDEFVSVVVLPGKKLKRSDSTNVIGTVSDWLEPASKLVGGKNKRARGWGIGLINDDRQVIGFCPSWDSIGFQREYTEILIRPWADLKESALMFISEHFFNERVFPSDANLWKPLDQIFSGGKQLKLIKGGK